MILYAPRSSVTVERDFSISAGLLASTETPGRIAPLWSLITPVKTLCARPPGKSTVKYTSDRKTLIVAGIVLDFLILPPKRQAKNQSEVVVFLRSDPELLVARRSQPRGPGFVLYRTTPLESST